MTPRRPAISHHSTGLIAALDIGGTTARGGLFTTDGVLIFLTESATGGVPGKIDPALAQSRAVLLALAHEAARRSHRLLALGAGFPEYVNNGLLQSHEVLQWTRQPGELFQEDLGPDVKIAIESDVRCGALAEVKLGAARGANSALYLSWGTGLSSSLLHGGTLVSGARGEAIGVGEFPVSGRTSPHWPHNLEQFASGKGIQQRYESVMGESVDGTRGVLDRANGGDLLAREIVLSAAQAVGETLSAITSLFDPETIILGGGIGSADDSLLITETRRVYEAIVERRPAAPPVVTALLGANAGLIGAALRTDAVTLPATSKLMG